MYRSDKDDEILEQISSVFDGEDLPEGRLQEFDAETRRHMQNWSLIGSAMRHELPRQIDLNFADKVMAEVSKIEPEIVEQPQNPELPQRRSFFKFNFNLKKIGMACTQLALAASVAAVTVIGWQTYSAGDVSELSSPASTAAMGQVSSVSLASYQNQNQDTILNLNDIAQRGDNIAADDRSNAEMLRQMQQKELERINSYVRGYVLHSAAD